MKEIDINNVNLESITKVMGEINKSIYGINPYKESEDKRENEQSHTLDVPEHDCGTPMGDGCAVCAEIWENPCHKPHNNAEGVESCLECQMINHNE